jgi:hypothetical protein
MQLGGTNITIQPLTPKTDPNKEIGEEFLGDILEDFDSSFKKEEPSAEPAQNIIGENVAIYNTEQQIRLNKIIDRIAHLDDSKPEYLEELISLETKKIQIEQEIESQKNNELNKKTLATEKQRQTVADLLAKKAFSYKASFLSPEEEEQKRLKFAQKSLGTENMAQQQEKERLAILNGPRRKIPVLTREDTTKIDEMIDVEMVHSQKARLLREELINHLRQTSRVSWFENPQKNREWINDHIVKTAATLSKKSGGEVDMHDIQTARLFLFQNAPQDIRNHPAYKYVESFYDFQYNQGHTGDVEKSKKVAPIIEMPAQEEKPVELSEEVKKELNGEPETEDAWDANLFS